MRLVLAGCPGPGREPDALARARRYHACRSGRLSIDGKCHAAASPPAWATTCGAIAPGHTVDVENLSKQTVLMTCSPWLRHRQVRPGAEASYRFGVSSHTVSCSVKVAAGEKLCRAKLTPLDPFYLDINHAGAVTCGGFDGPYSTGTEQELAPSE